MTVEIPKLKTGISRKKIKGKTYIYYEHGRKYYSDKQYTVPQCTSIGKDSGLFLVLAAYTIVAENNAAQYYPDYAYNHPLFTDGMKVYSDSKVSRFLRDICRDDSIAFQNVWNESRDHKEKIYISYDSTNKHC